MDLAKEIALQSSVRAGRVPLMSFCNATEEDFDSKSHIIVICNSTLDVYLAGNNELQYSLPWLSIVSVTLKALSLHLKFVERKLIFKTYQAKECYNIICHVLRQIHTKEELKLIGIKTDAPKIHNTGYGAFLRFRQKTSINGIDIPNKCIEELFCILKYQKSTINLGDFEHYKAFIPSFFDIVPLCPFITHLIVPKFAEIPSFAVYAAKMRYIQTLELEGPSTNKLSEFLKKLSGMPKLDLKCLSFRKAELSSSELKEINKFVLLKGITSLGFHKAISKEGQKFFYNGFFTPALSKQLTVANFDDTPDIDIPRILAHLESIVALSLARCKVQIGSAINEISRAKLPQLKLLNLSGNPCDMVPSAGIRLPDMIYSVVVNDVNFGRGCLLNFLRLAFGKAAPTGIKLSIANAQVDEKSAWPKAFEFLSGSKASNLCALTWDGNPVCPSFFSFLSHHPSLSYLSLNGCFTNKRPDEIVSLTNFVALSNLYFLRIRGDLGKELTLRDQTGPLVRTVANSQIVHLDISDNDIGDAGVSQLRQLMLRSRSIQVLAFDGSRPKNANSFCEAMAVAAKQFPRLAVSFPRGDLQELVDRRKISVERKREINSLFARPTKTKEGSAKVPSGSPFAAPYCVFVHTPAPPFPAFLTEEQIRLLETAAIPAPSVRSRSAAHSVRSSALSTPKSARCVKRVFIDTKPEGDSRSVRKVTAEKPISDVKSIASSRRSAIEAGPDAPERFNLPLFLQQNMAAGEYDDSDDDQFEYEYYSSEDEPASPKRVAPPLVISENSYTDDE